MQYLYDAYINTRINAYDCLFKKLKINLYNTNTYYTVIILN